MSIDVASQQRIQAPRVYHTRYFVQSAPNGRTYEVDGCTGESWMQLGEAERLQKVERPRHKPKVAMTDAERASIVGKGGFGYNSFQGQFYNGTDWNVSEVTLEITVKDTDHSLRWSRRFQTRVSISPYSTGSFAIDVCDCEAIGSFTWRLASAVGSTDRSEAWQF